MVTGTSRSHAHPKRESHGEVPRPQATSWALPLDRRRRRAFHHKPLQPPCYSPPKRLVAGLTRCRATAGIKVRCEIIERDRPPVAKVFSPNEVDIGRRFGVGGGGIPAVLDGLCRERGPQGQARDVAGHLRETLACIVNAAPPGIHALGSGRDATAVGWIVIVQTFAQRVGRDLALWHPPIPHKRIGRLRGW
jgi:hypothetical protein